MKFLFSLSFIFASLTAQVPDTLWTKKYGGEENDLGSAVLQTNDGGYLIVGTTQSFGLGGGDVWLLKTNEFGDTLWTKVYGRFNDDLGNTIINACNSGYIIGATTKSFDPGSRSDIWLIKIDSLGNIVWTKTYGGDGNDWLSSSESIKKTNDNGYIIVGTTTSFGAGARDIYLIKTDSIGNIQWTKTFGGTEFDDGWAVQQTADGGYIIAGMTNSFGVGNTDAYLIKTNASGDTIWTRTYGGSNWDDARAVLQTSDGGYIFTGHTESFGYGCDVYVVKTNSAGDTLWTKSYHPNIGGAEGNAIQNAFDSGYIIAGYTTTPTNEADIFLIKIDSLGTLLWNKTVGGLWEEDAYTIKQTSDSGYIIVGMTLPYGAENFDLYLVKIGPDIGGVEEIKKSINTTFNIFPNPAQELFTLQSHIPLKKIRIFNAAGQLEQEFIFNNHSILNTKISTTRLKSGVYFIQIYAEDIHQIKKLIIIR